MQFDSSRQPSDVDETQLLHARMLDAVMTLESQPHAWSGDELRRVIEDRLTAILGDALDLSCGAARRVLVNVNIKPDEAARYRRVADIAVEWGSAGEPGYWDWRHRFGRALMS